MTKRLLPSLLLAAAALLALRATQADDDPEATVPAKRYRVVWTADGGLELAHGGGQWIHEIFLPDAKVAAGVYPETDETGEHPRMYARHEEEPRNGLTGLHGGPPSAIEDIRIPAALAKQIVDLARLFEKFEAESVRLGKEAQTRLKLEPIPRDGG